MIGTIFAVLGIALALLLIWSGFIYVTGNSDAKAGMSLILFFGLSGIVGIATAVSVTYCLVFLIKFIIGLL